MSSPSVQCASALHSGGVPDPASASNTYTTTDATKASLYTYALLSKASRQKLPTSIISTAIPSQDILFFS